MERFTLDHRPEERRPASIALFKAFAEPRNPSFFSLTQRTTERVLEETLTEAGAKAWVIADEGGELCRTLKGTTRELTAWVDESATLTLSVAADRVEILKSEADEVHRAVTSAASWFT